MRKAQRLRLRPDKGCGRQITWQAPREGVVGEQGPGTVQVCPCHWLHTGVARFVGQRGGLAACWKSRRARPTAPHPLAAALTSLLSLTASSLSNTPPQLEGPWFPCPMGECCHPLSRSRSLMLVGRGDGEDTGERQEGRQAEWKGDRMALPRPTGPARFGEGLLLQPHHPDTICPPHDFPLLLPLPWSELT